MPFDDQHFFAALQPTVDKVDVAGFGTVFLRQITVAENDAIRKAASPDAPSEFGLRLLATALVTEDGAPVFRADDPSVLSAMRAASGTKIDALIRRVLELNGYVDNKAAAEKN